MVTFSATLAGELLLSGWIWLRSCRATCAGRLAWGIGKATHWCWALLGDGTQTQCGANRDDTTPSAPTRAAPVGCTYKQIRVITV